jgi:cytochrome c-type biogenesis protein CcmH
MSTQASQSTSQRILPIVVAAAVIALVLLVAIDVGSAGPSSARAQDFEAQAQQIESQLLCPQCTNKRLDICELAICVDMRELIRERLAAGDTPDDIILFFSNRYGERVLADLPKSGFNLVLFGWVGGSLVLVAALGTTALLRLRRTAALPAVEVLDAEGERWLDEQSAADASDRTSNGGSG